jgi:hypothetical protein
MGGAPYWPQARKEGAFYRDESPLGVRRKRSCRYRGSCFALRHLQKQISEIAWLIQGTKEE